MEDLARWLGEQFDEDERIAKAVGFATIQSGEYLWGSKYLLLQGDEGGESKVTTELDGDLAEHIARHDPARVLAEVEAKRELLKLHQPEEIPEHSRRSWQTFTVQCAGESWKVYGDAENRVEWPCRSVRLLALPYADRPGYREDWRP